MGGFRLSLALACALLGSIQAFATTGDENPDARPDEMTDEVIQFFSGWIDSTTTSKSRTLQEKNAEAFSDAIARGACELAVRTFLNPTTALKWYQPNDNVITKDELTTALREFMCTVQKATCPLTAKLVSNETQTTALESVETYTGFELVGAANNLDCDDIMWNKNKATERCTNMAVCMDTILPVLGVNYTVSVFDSAKFSRASQMGSLLCGIHSLVDLMYEVINFIPDAIGPNTVKGAVGVMFNPKDDNSAYISPVGLYTDSVVDQCVEGNWIMPKATD